MDQPRVSIIMGIYNCEKTLRRSFDSLLHQTYTNWQLIMCDDGSTDQTYQIAQGLQQKWPNRIVLLRNSHNLGLNQTLNRCLDIAEGTYIARQDADDLSVPSRLQTEVKFLDQHQEYALVSSGKDHFDENGVWGTYPEIEQPTMKDIFFGPPFCHAAVMMRRSALEKVGGYSVADKLLRVEDYHLWYKFYRAGFKGYNLQETLYLCEDDRHAYARRSFKNRLNEMCLKQLILKQEKLPRHYYLYTLRPLLVGLLPLPLYHFLHQRRLQN